MARKTTFTREDVVAAALRVIDQEGLGALSARRVAEAMKASTAPVYSNFANMDELLAVVMDAAATSVLEYCRRPWSDDEFLNMGLGFVHFAVDHPRLFRAMYLESRLGKENDGRVESGLLDDLARHTLLGQLPEDHREELLFQASIYTLGIATTVVTGLWDEPDLATVESWLRSVGGLLVGAAVESAGLAVPDGTFAMTEDFVVPWRHRRCSNAEEDHEG